MTTAVIHPIAAPAELEPDNSARLVIFDAMCDARDEGTVEVTFDELFERVIARLKKLVPRELHNMGDRGYVEEKVAICVEAGVLVLAGEDRYTLADEPQAWIRYPDDSIRRYAHGLIAARERLDKINTILRDRRFDITKHLPHHKPSSPEFRALVRSMGEHGFLKQFAIYRFADGTYVDGVARIAAAAEAGLAEKTLELRQQDPETTRMRRRDTPLHRVLLAVDANAVRLTDGERRHALDAAAAAAGSSWEEIEKDLTITRDWRGATARSYTPLFEVTEIPFGGDGSPTVLATPNHKIHVTSLLRASGLAKHKFEKELQAYVPGAEKGRAKGGGASAWFAGATDMVDGLEDMLSERSEKRRTISAEWEVCLAWLRRYVRTHRISDRN